MTGWICGALCFFLFVDVENLVARFRFESCCCTALVVLCLFPNSLRFACIGRRGSSLGKIVTLIEAIFQTSNENN